MSHPGWHVEWLPSPRRVRVELGHETVADSTRTMLLRQHGFLPVHYFPREDLRGELLEPSEHTTYSPYKGRASYWTVRAGDRHAESAAWSYLEPKPGSPDTRGYVSFDFHSMDAWFEEDEQMFVHARDPFHRVDALPSSRRVRVLIDGTVVADTPRAVLLFETSLITRYYVPLADVRLDVLEPSDTFSMCPYKGRAGYYSVRIGESFHRDAAWCYRTPRRDVHRIETTSRSGTSATRSSSTACFSSDRSHGRTPPGARRSRPSGGSSQFRRRRACGARGQGRCSTTTRNRTDARKARRSSTWTSPWSAPAATDRAGVSVRRATSCSSRTHGHDTAPDRHMPASTIPARRVSASRGLVVTASSCAPISEQPVAGHTNAGSTFGLNEDEADTENPGGEDPAGDHGNEGPGSEDEADGHAP